MHEGPKNYVEEVENSSVWLSPEEAASMEFVTTVTDQSSNDLRVMRTKNDRYFCELVKKPDQQAAVATLMKGIIPVCDIKRVETEEGNKYYSYVVPLEGEQYTGVTSDEVQAYSYILELLFSDPEHNVNSVTGGLKNVRLDDNNRAVLFDFDLASFNRKLTEDDALEILSYSADEHPRSLSIVKDKLTKFQEQLNGEEGKRWFHKVLDHVDYNNKHYNLFLERDELYELLIKDVAVALDSVNKMIPSSVN